MKKSLTHSLAFKLIYMYYRTFVYDMPDFIYKGRYYVYILYVIFPRSSLSGILLQKGI